MQSINKRHLEQFQKKILDWYSTHQRDLPWRRTRDPYHILVSEVMLQQTQVSRVVPKFEEWLGRFPTIDRLARATTADVLQYWSGLGYNRRALYLKKGAETIVREYKGQFPRDIVSLKKIPGIGEYTARALLCFAFDEQVAVVDTNVRKVILVEFLSYHYEKSKTTKQSLKHQKDCRASLAMTERCLQEIAEQLLPSGKAYEWNQALMDYANLEMADEKIDIPKQSKFIGSNRYYRGQTIKYLLQHKNLSQEKLKQLLNLDAEKFEAILTSLVKDGFVEQKKNTISLLHD